MRKNSHIATLVLMSLLLTGCSSGGDDMSTSRKQAIRLNVEKAKVTEGGWDTRATTFSSKADLQANSPFKCYAYEDGGTTIYDNISNTSVNYNNGVWSFENGTHDCPEVSTLNFYAYMPTTAAELEKTYCEYSYTNKNPVITCTNLPVTIKKGSDYTQEYIYAYTPGQTKTANSDDGVTLMFQHPFARVCFKLTDASGTSVRVNSITIEGIKNNGTYTCNNSTWTPSGDDANLVISQSDSESAATGDDYYLVVPNNYGNKTLTVNATWDEWGSVTKDVTATIACNWEPGNCYIYKLTLSEYAVVVNVTDKYTEQW